MQEFFITQDDLGEMKFSVYFCSHHKSAAISYDWDLFRFVWIYQRFNVDLEIFKFGLYVLERLPYKAIMDQNIA